MHLLMYKYSLRLIKTYLTSKSYSTSLDGLCVNSSTFSWTLFILASLYAHFHRRCEKQFLNNHLYQCRVLWWLYFYKVTYKPINNKPTPAWLFHIPYFPA